MAQFFLSYARSAEEVVGLLVSDIENLGHRVWYDDDLTGGQAWWVAILEKIEGADVFVLAIDPGAVASVACRREFAYARALGVPILPILISDAVSIATLPAEVAELNIVDYTTRDTGAALRLARTIAALPPRPELPDPMPEKPSVPLSYLAGLVAKIRSEEELNENDQALLLAELMAGLEKEDVGAEVPALAEEFLARRELRAHIAAAMRFALRAAASEGGDDRPRQPVPGPDVSHETPLAPAAGASADTSQGPTEAGIDHMAAAETGAAVSSPSNSESLEQAVRKSDRAPEAKAPRPPGRSWRRTIALSLGVLIWTALVAYVPVWSIWDATRFTERSFSFPADEIALLALANVVCLGVALHLLARRRKRGGFDLRVSTVIAFFVGIWPLAFFDNASYRSFPLALPFEGINDTLQNNWHVLADFGQLYVGVFGFGLAFWPAVIAMLVAVLGRVIWR